MQLQAERPEEDEDQMFDDEKKKMDLKKNVSDA